MNHPQSAQVLRDLLSSNTFLTMPCCFDALSAKLIEQKGFALTFMSGFATSASRIGAPDLGLMCYSEVLDSASNICDQITIPLIGDGDTGYGNPMNVRRTVEGFAKAGCAAIMIEDQLAPKRCGHTPGKEVVDREEAFDRIGFKMANIVENGLTPDLPPDQLEELGFSIAAYPLSLMSAAMKAMLETLDALRTGQPRDKLLLDFSELRQRIGFDDYYETSNRYRSAQRKETAPE